MPHSNELYRELDHTADIAIEVAATSRAELFRKVLLAVAQLMVSVDGIEARESRRLAIAGETDSERLHDLAAAALGLFFGDGFIWCDAHVTEISSQVVAVLKGEPFDPSRHRFIRELKAVTWHELKVERHAGGFRATLVFDV